MELQIKEVRQMVANMDRKLDGLDRKIDGRLQKVEELLRAQPRYYPPPPPSRLSFGSLFNLLKSLRWVVLFLVVLVAGWKYMQPLSEFGFVKTYCSWKNTLYTPKYCWSRDVAQRAPRVLVIGETKAGKSTFLNVLMGHKFVFEDGAQKWYTLGEDPVEVSNTSLLFKPGGGRKTTTQESSFVYTHWLKNSSRLFLGIDSPGRGEAKTTTEIVHCDDMFEKLQSLGKVDHILILGTRDQLVAGSKLLDMLKVVDKNIDISASSDSSESDMQNEHKWKHISVVCTKANPYDRSSWEPERENNDQQLRASIKEWFQEELLLPSRKESDRQKKLGWQANDIEFFYAGGAALNTTQEAIDPKTFDHLWNRVEDSYKNPTSLVAKKPGDNWYCGAVDLREKQQKEFKASLVLFALFILVVTFLSLLCPPLGAAVSFVLGNLCNNCCGMVAVVLLALVLPFWLQDKSIPLMVAHAAGSRSLSSAFRLAGMLAGSLLPS